jgi:hypothetical protein
MKAIGRMKFANLAHYGMLPDNPQDLAFMIVTWVDVLAELGVPECAVEPAAKWFAAHGDRFPSAADFAKKALALYDAQFVTVGIQVDAAGTLANVRVPKGLIGESRSRHIEDALARQGLSRFHEPLSLPGMEEQYTREEVASKLKRIIEKTKLSDFSTSESDQQTCS